MKVSPAWRCSAWSVALAFGIAHAGDRPPQPADGAPPASAAGRVQGQLVLVPVKPTFPPASAEARAAVTLEISRGQTSASGVPGFLAVIKGWTPNGRITATLVGSKGESVDVIPFEQPMQIGPDGSATLLVPYTLAGLAPGAWKFVIDGASGEHALDVEIPVVHPADAEHKAAWVSDASETAMPPPTH